MTLKETLALGACILLAFSFLVGFVILIVRRTMNKPLKKERKCDHYHSGHDASGYDSGGHDSGGGDGGLQ